MRVVLDTNILVSGLLTPEGSCRRILDLVLDGTLRPCADDRILEEYARVLRRASLNLPAAHVDDLLDVVRHGGERIVAGPLPARLPDSSDTPFLEVAATAEAVLVTGNTRHFPAAACAPVPVVGPAEFLGILGRISGPGD